MNNTTVVTRDGWLTVTYHKTDVFKQSGNQIILNSGGYKTATTKRRINQFLPEHLTLVQRSGNWKIVNSNTGVSYTFIDNQLISAVSGAHINSSKDAELQHGTYCYNVSSKDFALLSRLDFLDDVLPPLGKAGAFNIEYNGHYGESIYFSCEPGHKETVLNAIDALLENAKRLAVTGKLPSAIGV